MRAVFYDRRNNREVNSTELQRTKFVEYVAVGDNDDEMIPTGRRYSPVHGEPMTKETYEEYLKSGIMEAVLSAWETWKEEKTPRVVYLKEQLIADLCYRGENLDASRNWDFTTTVQDLVFLRLEDDSDSAS